MANLKRLIANGATCLRHSDWKPGEYVVLASDRSGLDYSLGAGTLVIPLRDHPQEGWVEYRKPSWFVNDANHTSDIFSEA